MRGELREGIARTIPFVLAHHPRSQRNRCHRVTLRGRQVDLCARCSGIYPGLLASLLFPLHPTPIPLIALLPLPALVDWIVTTFRSYHDSNAIRTATGLSLGYGYGAGLIAVLTEGSLAVVLVGVGYGVVAMALLSVQPTGEV